MLCSKHLGHVSCCLLDTKIKNCPLIYSSKKKLTDSSKFELYAQNELFGIFKRRFMSEGSLVSQNALIIKDLRAVSACNLSYRSKLNTFFYKKIPFCCISTAKGEC